MKICLAKDPDDRWQTAREVLRELKWATETGASPVGPAQAAFPLRERLAWIVAAVGLIAVVVVAQAKPEEGHAVRFAVPAPPDAAFGPAAFVAVHAHHGSIAACATHLTLV